MRLTSGRKARLAVTVLTGGVLAAAAACSGSAGAGRDVGWLRTAVQDADAGPGPRGASRRGLADLRA